MKIIIDFMSGDNAPSSQLKGALAAASQKKNIGFILVGDKNVADVTASALGLSADLDNVEFVQSHGVVSMDDSALSVVREKRDSSLGMGLKLLAEGRGDAFVSSGNTGALHAGSTLIVRRIKGIKKSAIATILPYANPTLLIDSGANIDMEPETYLQFAKMGTVYLTKILGVTSPRVGLLNIGSERTKGSKLLQEAYGLLEADGDINFIGNVEGRDLPFGKCDVVVCDGFSGNIVLKLTEGCAEYLMKKVKNVMTSNPVAKVSALALKGGFMSMKEEFDASKYGGAPLLGLSKTVIKAHGGSNDVAFENAVYQAIKCVENGISFEIASKIVPHILESNSEGWEGK